MILTHIFSAHLAFFILLGFTMILQQTRYIASSFCRFLSNNLNLDFSIYDMYVTTQNTKSIMFKDP